MSTPKKREKMRQSRTPSPDEPDIRRREGSGILQQDGSSNPQQSTKVAPDGPKQLEEIDILAHVSWVLLQARSDVDKKNILFFELLIDGLLVVLNVLASVSYRRLHLFEA